MLADIPTKTTKPLVRGKSGVGKQGPFVGKKHPSRTQNRQIRPKTRAQDRSNTPETAQNTPKT